MSHPRPPSDSPDMPAARAAAPAAAGAAAGAANGLDVDALIVGAGPVGLYAAYYAGFRNRSVAVMDSLPEIGGQVSAMYPEKLIYDVAGLPAVRGRDLIAALAEQAGQYGPRYLLGEEARFLQYPFGVFAPLRNHAKTGQFLSSSTNARITQRLSWVR